MAELSRRSLVAAAASTLLLPSAARAERGDPIVATIAGRVRGVREGGVAVFKGIRYGADTRPRRFQAPLTPTQWRDIRPATAFGPACPQSSQRTGTSEDCLFLNVWTPGLERGARRPVMVYIHGGAYANGSGSDPLTEGARLAASGDVVVVTLNHRLNAFGYLYLARLSDRFPDSGNAGQLDLILALRWVRDNIAAFGGDPAKVTLFGQSGGGAKIATLMGTPAAAGLFRAAATMSGQQVTASGPLNATRRARAYMAALGAERPEAVLDMTAERLVDALSTRDPIISGSLSFAPVLDDQTLLRHPFWPDAHPQSNALPMILGNTRDETRAFFDPARPPLAGLDWSNLAERLGPELRVDILPETVVAFYRARFPAYTPAEVFFAATTAGRSWRGQVEEANARAAAGSPTWVYQLDFPAPLDPARGAYHTLDIPLVFGTLDAEGSKTGTGPAARAVSERMADAFLALAKRGDPNHRGMPAWPRYDLTRRATMIFDESARVANDPRREERELFARVPYIQPGS